MVAGAPRRPLLRVGHKGADAVVPGNTIASFEAAAEIGVDVIELDVLRPRSDFGHAEDWRDAVAGPVTGDCEPLVVAHDWGAADRGDPPTLAEALDAFTRPPLDRVEIDLDLKIAGREDEVVAAVRERDLTARAMVSTMEVPSVAARALARARPARRLDLPARHSALGPQALGAACAPGRGGRDAPAPAVAGREARAGAGSLGDVGLPPARHPAPRGGSARRGRGADRLDGRRPRPHARAGGDRGRRHRHQRPPPAVGEVDAATPAGERLAAAPPTPGRPA